MAVAEERLHTVEEIYALPEEQRAELIDGVIYDLAAPNRIHQEISVNLSADIRDYIREHGGNCKVYTAPFAVRLTDDKYNYLEPDISVICDLEKLDDLGCKGAPDWIIEIVSPSSRQMDYMRKMLKYATHGVRLYWVIDPDKQSVRVFDFEHNDTEDYGFDESLPVAIWPDANMRIT